MEPTVIGWIVLICVFVFIFVIFLYLSLKSKTAPIQLPNSRGEPKAYMKHVNKLEIKSRQISEYAAFLDVLKTCFELLFKDDCDELLMNMDNQEKEHSKKKLLLVKQRLTKEAANSSVIMQQIDHNLSRLEHLVSKSDSQVDELEALALVQLWVAVFILEKTQAQT
jgi:hypothetical protein